MLAVLLKKQVDTKITEIEKKLSDHDHDKYVTTPEFNTLAANVFNARLAQANLITKTDFDAKLSSLNRKITANKTRYSLIENELKKLETWFELFYRQKSFWRRWCTKLCSISATEQIF